jgi:hypothetical protein
MDITAAEMRLRASNLRREAESLTGETRQDWLDMALKWELLSHQVEAHERNVAKLREDSGGATFRHLDPMPPEGTGSND